MGAWLAFPLCLAFARAVLVARDEKKPNHFYDALITTTTTTTL